MSYKRLHAPKTNLRAWRKYRGFTQLAVQERLGMHVYRLSHIETGRAPLNEETLNALAELYDCSADDLLNREPGGKTLPADRLSFEGERLLREMQRDLADIRNARTVTIQMLAKHNATLNTISAEQRALRSQLDRFRAEMRKELSALRAVLSGGDERGNG